jgi:type II secretory ATPase GspE/PulE/Tfp pilus assembly ATPase PilB-like protein
LINNHGVAISPEIVESSPDGGLAAACKIIQEAVNLEATDIHLQPEPGQLLVRYRLDGVLQNGQTYPAEAGAHIVSAVKVLADMDVAEKRRAQDGAFSALASHGKINFRVSSVGIADGEKMALRLLDKSKGLRTIKDLGFSKAMHARVEALLQSSHGVFVVCGPTGCGKTTTLYAALQELDRHALNIITIENPIEYRLDGINQQSINEKAGITFAGLLRTSLRQDPDILMVGEVRDKETAEIAMQAAMTGHLVFTTVHANDTVSAMFRLMNLGVEPFLISSSLAGVLAQRLVRRVCMQCRGARKPTEEEMNLFAKVGFKPEQVRAIPVVKGCKACRNTGYKGRVGIFELLTINDDIRSLIQHNPSVTDMKKAALKAGLVRLGQDAMQKAACGITSLEDAQRACR